VSTEETWNTAVSAEITSEVLPLDRSGVLGRDGRAANYSGGNSSATTEMVDALTDALSPFAADFASCDLPEVGHFDDSDFMQFVNSEAFTKLAAALCTSCPDHFLKIKGPALDIAFRPAGRKRSGFAQTFAGCDRPISR
jgi:rhamnose utilization protein RhaD (predicted bifunctional aldolase and dehydrogenase)